MGSNVGKAPHGSRFQRVPDRFRGPTSEPFGAGRKCTPSFPGRFSISSFLPRFKWEGACHHLAQHSLFANSLAGPAIAWRSFPASSRVGLLSASRRPANRKWIAQRLVLQIQVTLGESATGEGEPKPRNAAMMRCHGAFEQDHDDGRLKRVALGILTRGSDVQ